METKRKALGKGLEQLFNSENVNFEDVEREIVANATESDIQEIPISAIRSNPFQPRKRTKKAADRIFADRKGRG